MDALRAYLKAERGRGAKLADALGISQSAISMWNEVPSDRLLAIEEATGIPRENLRPDLYREGAAA